MTDICAPATEKLSRTVVVRMLAATVAVLVMLCLSSTATFGQCATLGGTVSNWTGGNGNWNNGSDWDNGVPNSATTSACINNGTAGTPTTVNLNINASIEDLGIGTYDTLNFNEGAQLSVYGTQIVNAGQIVINGGSGNTYLLLDNSVTLSGGGTLTLNTTTSGGGSAWLQQNGAYTLDNVDNTIQGEGIIYNNSSTIINEAHGTINANSTGGALTGTLLLEFGNVTNAGVLSATNSGTLELLSNTINNAGGNITANGANATVEIASTTVYGGTLNNNTGGTMETVGVSTLDGSTVSGAINLSSGSTYTTAAGAQTNLLGTINNQGTFYVSGGSSNSYLNLNDSVTLQGGGTITLNTTTSGGGNAYLYQNGAYTLTNVNNLIQGEGIIYNNGATIINEAGGTINANSTGGALATTLLLEYGTVTNQGVLEATNSGTLQLLDNTINNAGSSITASGAGATVQVASTTIYGGTLNNNTGGLMETVGTALLDGKTQGALTLNGTYTTAAGATTYTLGTINNNGLFYVSGGANNTYLELTGDTTLQGGGTITLNTTASGGGYAQLYQGGGYTLNNVNNLIQGEGVIYNNGAVLNNQATINANSTGGLLATTLALEYGTVNNTGLLEATNSGTLQLLDNVIYNAGANITAGGAGTKVDVAGTTIYGGTLNNNGGTLETVGSATLDGKTTGALTLNGTYTTAAGATTYTLGTINNNGLFYVSGGANNTYLELTGDTTLQGGGTITLNTTASGGGYAFLYQGGGYTLTNFNNTIQGEGQIYNAGGTIINEATINANSTGGALANTLYLAYGHIFNTGLLEATNSGDLNLYNAYVYNAGGNITAGGAGTSVDVTGTTIFGGTLNNNGGTMDTVGTATLDGKTTGALTLNGTYKTTAGATTYILGTINNNGDFYVSGGANNTYLELAQGNTTLQGNGTVTLSTTAGGGGYAWLYQGGGYTLDNVGNTIQGSGIIYNNGATIINEAGGTIIANSTGSPLSTTLEIDYGTVTNNGTFQVNSGDTLHMLGGNLTNFAGNTLTGGTYNVYGTVANPGTLQIDSLGNTGGEIVNNAATILLDGPNSNFVDQAGLDALSNFSNNTATGSFTIQDGRNFTSPGDFANAGTVGIGATSTFTTGGAGNYNQSGGSTQVDGALVAGGGQVNINGGTLFGNGGTITGNVMMAGTIYPGDAPNTAGKLSITGNYMQTGTGAFNLSLGGLGQGAQFSWLNVSGNASLAGTLNVGLISSFFPTVGETFTFLTAGGSRSGIFSTVNGLNIGGNEALTVIYDPNDVKIQAIMCANGSDCWVGGTDIWSKASKWTLGEPVAASDVYINSGVANDVVTLNVGSTTVNSVQLGEASGGGFTSELTDGGTKQTLNITNELAIGQTGTLSFTGGSTVNAGSASNQGTIQLSNGSMATLGSLNNNGGFVDLEKGSTLQINGDVTNSGLMYTSFSGGGGNTLNITGNLTNSGFVGLESTDTVTISGNVTNNGTGTFDLTGGAKATIGALMNTAATTTVDLENASTLKITGNADNFGTLSTGANSGTGGNTITITGMLTNESGATFELLGHGSADMATIGGLNNSGFADVDGGSTLQVNGNVTNTSGLYTGYDGGSGNKLNISGTLTNYETFTLYGPGDTATVGGTITNVGAVSLFGHGSMLTTAGLAANSGVVDVDNGSTLQINGNAVNSDFLATDFHSYGGGNTLNITGTLTNNSGSDVLLYGAGDVANVGKLTNNGYTYVGPGATLNLTNQAGGITSTGAGTRFDLLGSFNDIAGGGGGFAHLTNNGGTVIIANGQTTGITPNGGTFTNSSGLLDVSGSTVQINGDVSNVEEIYTGNYYTSNASTLTITGNLSNQYALNMYNAGDTVNVNGNLDNIDQINFNNANQTLTVGGNLTNEANGQISVAGAGSLLQVNGMGGLTNLGAITVSGGGAIDPLVLTNGGTITIDGMSKLVVGTGMAGQGYTQFSNGTLGEMIFSANNFGVINVTGAANLAMGSTLDILLQGGYDPANGTLIRFLNFTPGQLTGTFGSILNDTFNNGKQYWMLVAGSGFLELEAEPVMSGGTDSWLGGTNHWSNGNFWSLTNPPAPNQDAVIYSGGFDMVTMDFGSTTINSLQLGGAANGTTSELTDGGNAENLTITNGLNIGATGSLVLSGASTVTAATMTNSGGVVIGSNATVNLTNQPGGFSDVPTLSGWQIFGNLELGGVANIAFANLTTVEGFLDLENGQKWAINPIGGTLTVAGGSINHPAYLEDASGTTMTINGNVSTNANGNVIADTGSTIQINGNADNFGGFGTHGGSTINITGTFTNEASGGFILEGAKDKVTIDNGLSNAGGIGMQGGSTLAVTGAADNSGLIQTNFNGGGGNSTITISGKLTNDATGMFELLGPGDMATIGSLTNKAGGFVDVEGGSTLNITGSVDNFGQFVTNDGIYGFGGKDTINIGGMLTNEAGGTFQLNGPTDMATIGTPGMPTSMSNAGTVDLENGSSLTVNGTVDNSGTLSTSANGGTGSNTITITGMLTNEPGAQFTLGGPTDMATLGSLNNAGTVNVDMGSTLTVMGAVTNSGDIFTDPGSNTITITGALTNQAGANFILNGPMDMATIGSGMGTALTNNAGGFVDVDGGSTLALMGDVTNSGTIQTDPGHNTITISGMLTNKAGAEFILVGPGDMATIGTSGMPTSMSNAGDVELLSGSSLTVNGTAHNSGELATSGDGGTGHVTLTITGMLTNTGSLDLDGTGDMATLGSLNNSGNVTSKNGSTLNITGALTNSGTFKVLGPGDTATIGNGVTNAAGGTIDVEHGGTLTMSGAVDNSGTLETNFKGNGGGNTITSNGLLTNEATGQITLNGPGDVLQALAGLSNNGVITVSHGSSIDPPFVNNGGTITIDGSSRLVVGTPTPMGGQGYIQLANGTLGEVINGYGPCGTGNCGLINVTGSALLAGTLDIMLKQGFNPTVGSEFTILTASPGQLSGNFTSILNDCFNNQMECWAVTYDYADGLLELTANPVPPPVSEPATLAVLIPGLMAAGYGLRRRLSK